MIFLAILAAASAPSMSKPCTIIWTGHDDLMNRLREEGGFQFEGYEKLCAALKARGMGVSVSSSNGVLADRSYGWVAVRLYDLKTGVVGSQVRNATTLSRTPSTIQADKAEMDSLNYALSYIAKEQELYISSVDEAVSRLRVSFGNGQLPSKREGADIAN